MSTVSLNLLTPREREILALIAEGDSLAEIAHKLHRSLKTIESHRLSLGRKLKASNRVELAKIAIAEGLITLEPSESSPAHHGDSPQAAEQELACLEQINNAVYNTTGMAFLQSFCKAASVLADIGIAGICIADPTHPEADSAYCRLVMAISEAGQDLQPIRYDAVDTPCQQVIDQGECCIIQGIGDLYPNNLWLAEAKAQSYIGIQLRAAKGSCVGVLGLVGRAPIDNAAALRRVMNFFAPRLTSALQACIELHELRNQCDQLQESPMTIDPAIIAATNPSELTSSSFALAQIMRQVQPLAGAPFLRGIVDAICDTFGLEHTGICMLKEASGEQGLQSIVYRKGGEQIDEITYKVNHTPCEKTLSDGMVCHSSAVAAAYPDDAFLIENKIESYIGIRLSAPTGETLGALWALDRRPLSDPLAIQKVFEYFAPRIGAELLNFKQFQALLEERERLESKLNREKN